MKKNLLTTFLLSAGTLFAGEVFTVDPMDKIDREQVIDGAPIPIALDAMRNEHELFHLLVRSNQGALLTVSAGDLTGNNGETISADRIRFRLAHYMHCEKHIKSPQWLPDALLPFQGKFALKANQNQSIYGDLYIPKDTVPGDYTGTIAVRMDGETTEIPISVTVRALTLPDMPSYQSAFAIWGGEQLTAPYPGIQSGSPEYQKLLETVYWFMTDYRLPPTDIPVPLDSPEAERYLSHPKVNSFRIPYNPENPEKTIQICNILREKGLLDRGFVYTIDEPARNRYGECVDYAAKLHEAVPDVRFLLTVNHGVSQDLVGSVDLWCPILSCFDQRYFSVRQAAGENVWWYTCIYPQQPYPTYLINDTGISPRILNWLQAKYAVEGNLYWAINIWKKYNPEKEQYDGVRDVWTDPLAFPGANGDGYLIYPAANPFDEPVPSLRLELIRQANEDFDTLTLLEQALDKTAQELNVPNYNARERIARLVNRIAQGMTTFTQDVKEFNQLRQDVLVELENLQSPAAAVLQANVAEGEIPKNTPIQLDIWTPENSAVTVDLLSQNKKNSVEKISENRYVFHLADKERIRVTVEKDGHKAEYFREFHPQMEEDQSMAILDWNSPDIEQALLYNDSSSKTVPGSIAHKFTFHPNVEFANFQLPIQENTAPYRWIRLVLSNPSATLELDATLKLHGARNLDGTVLALPPGSRQTLVFPFNGKNCSPEDAFNKVEIWLPQHAVNRDLIVEGITLHSIRPQGDNL